MGKKSRRPSRQVKAQYRKERCKYERRFRDGQRSAELWVDQAECLEALGLPTDLPPEYRDSVIALAGQGAAEHLRPKPVEGARVMTKQVAPAPVGRIEALLRSMVADSQQHTA